MTDMTKTQDLTADTAMTTVAGVSFTAHSFKGDLLHTPSAVAALTSEVAPANHSYPSVMQQIEMYCRLKRARGEKPF